MLKIWFAHEVYVLTPSEITTAEHAPKVNILDALGSTANLRALILYSTAIVVLLLLVLCIKSLPGSQKIGRLIDGGTTYVPDIIRIVFGISLIFSAQHQAVFGPELPVDQFAFSGFIVPFLYFSGIALILGIRVRLLGILTALFWLFTLINHGWYMLNYVNYFGESLALILLYRQRFSLDRMIMKTQKVSTVAYEKWAMPTARILLGFSILYAAINVKFVTTAMSLDVAQQYELTRYFHFDPLFIVLGAALVESLIAVLFILGLLRRLNAVVFIGFIVLSIMFFKESVWPHYLLLGLAAGIFMHKADSLALDRYLPARRKQ